MIDYIKILKIVLTKINDTIKLHTKKLNNDKFEPNKDPELRKLLIMHPILYYIGMLATILPLFFIIISLCKSQTIAMTKLILTICTLIVGIILLLIDLKTYNNIIKIRYKLTKQHNDFIWETTKTGGNRPNKNYDISSYKVFNADKYLAELQTDSKEVRIDYENFCKIIQTIIPIIQ